MNYATPIAFIAIFFLIVQTVLFGAAWRACQFSLDIPSQLVHNGPIVNNSGPHHVTLNDRCLRNPLEC